MSKTRKTNKTNKKKGNYLHINTSYPGLVQISYDPPMYMIDNFLTDEECDTLMNMGKEKQMAVSEVVNPNESSVSNYRKSNTLFVPYEDVPSIKEKAEELLLRPQKTFENLQITHYDENGYYKRHWDSFETDTEEGKRNLERGGQRVATLLIYLNTTTKGGGTYFPKINKRFMPKKGRAILFFPCQLDGTVDLNTLHRAEKVHGEKWVSQIWVRQRTFTS